MHALTYAEEESDGGEGESVEGGGGSDAIGGEGGGGGGEVGGEGEDEGDAVGERGGASDPPAKPSTTLTAAAALVPAAAAPSAALVPAARAVLIERAEAAMKKATRWRIEGVDDALCSSFQGVEAGGALAAVQSLCDPLHNSSLGAARTAFYREETGKQLRGHEKPPPTALWPGDCEQPPGGRVILLPGFKNQGVQTTLRKQFWLRVAVALDVCIRRGQRMAMRRCKIQSGENRENIALIMCAPCLAPVVFLLLAPPQNLCANRPRPLPAATRTAQRSWCASCRRSTSPR